MKKEVMVCLVFVIFLGIVSACSPDQRIMKLSSASNAHGALWNDVIYSTEICYDSIFGSAYAGSSPHNCTGTNRILSLSSSTNAHASVVHDSTYNIDVCYGNLQCNARSSCNADETAVTRLSLSSNAHLSNSAGTYSTIICCKHSTSITSAYWANMIGNPIIESKQGARVKLILSGLNLQGREINYTIYKRCTGIGCLVSWIFGEKKITPDSEKGYTTWKIGETGTFYFKAEVNGAENISGDLEVGTGSFSKPNARILTPADRGIYFVNENINFSQESWDAESYINYTWNIGGILIKGSSVDYGNYSFLRQFSLAGQKNVILTVVNEHGLSNESRVSILTAGNSVNVLAYIDRPRLNEAFIGRDIPFNATGSYAINAETAISCIAGNCPATTSGCRNSVCNENVIGTPNWTGFESLNFSWQFDGAGSSRSGSGMEGAVFTKIIQTAGNHNAVLDAFLSATSRASIDFFSSFSSPFCKLESGKSYWIEDSRQTDSFNDCARTGKTCCPSGYKCVNNKCEISGETYCRDYETQSECSGFSTSVANFDVESKTEDGYCDPGISLFTGKENGRNCYNLTENCRCFWNGTACDSTYSYRKECEGGLSHDLGRCDFRIIEVTNCTEGFTSVKWDAEWTGEGSDANCISGERKTRCSEEMGYFSEISLVIAISLLLFYYIQRS